MKSLLILAALGVLCVAAWLAYPHLGGASGARAAYEHHATATLYGRTAAKTGDIQSVEYELESRTERAGAVELVAVQSVTRLQRDSSGAPAGRPEVSKARQRARVERVGDAWQVTSLESERLD